MPTTASPAATTANPTTMEPTDLRALWTEHRNRVERLEATAKPLLLDLAVRRARSALRPVLLVHALESALAAAAAVAVATVLLAHRTDALYVAAAAPTLAWLAGLALHAGWQAVLGRRIDAAASVADAQRALLGLRRAEFAALRWAVLGGVFAWLPLGALLLEAATGATLLAALPLPWLFANLALGAVLWLASPFLGARLERAATSSPRTQRLLDALSSRGVRQAEAELREVATFAGEGST